MLSLGRYEAAVGLDDPKGMISCAVEADTIVDYVNGLRREHVVVVLLVVVLGKIRAVGN